MIALKYSATQFQLRVELTPVVCTNSYLQAVREAKSAFSQSGTPPLSLYPLVVKLNQSTMKMSSWVFELCILIAHKPAFATSSLQFGFKQGLTTDLCTGLIKNVIAHYTVKDTEVFSYFLDASKAFDRVDHSVLF